MNVKIANRIFIEDPCESVIAWAKANLKFANPEYEKKQRMGFWVGRTPKELRMYEWDGNTLILPFGVCKEIMPLIKDAFITCDFRQDSVIDYGGTPMKLYDYQEEAVNGMVSAKYGILKATTGSGKTQMGIALIKTFRRRALWLCHTADLLKQSRDRALQYTDPETIGTITEGKVNVGVGVTFATVQTMANLELTQYRDYWDVVIVDECFPGDTNILTESGIKQIRDITKRDKVIALDSNGNLKKRRIKKVFKKIPKSLVKITLENGSHVYCTANHPILTERGYVNAGHLTHYDSVYCLRENDRHIVSATGKEEQYSARELPLFSGTAEPGQEEGRISEFVRVESVEIQEQTSDGTYGGLCSDGYVYNLHVSRNHNYFANGMNVHNCHRVSSSATTFTRYEKVLNHLSARHKIGLTATPDRSDGLIRATYALIGKVAYEVPDSAVADRVMGVKIWRMDTGIELDEDVCLNDDGTINYTKLIEYLTTHENRNRQIATAIMNNKNHSCLILSERLNQLEAIRALLPYEMQEESAFINGKMTSKKGKAEREQAIEDMRTGKKKYLFASYSLAKEGLDIPCLDRLFLASPAKFSSVITQAVGRIRRTAEGKDMPVVIDIVDEEIGYCERAWKERCRSYRKIGAEIGRGF